MWGIQLLGKIKKKKCKKTKVKEDLENTKGKNGGVGR